MQFDFTKSIILENEFLLLRPISMDDVDRLEPVATEYPALVQYSPIEIHTKELLRRYVATAIAERHEAKRYTFSIYAKKQAAYIGSTAYLNIADRDLRLEIGATWIGRKFQGTGLNRQCKYLMLEYGFDQLGANRIEFRTDERNLQSRKAIEKIGGIFEGILREHTLLPDGFMRNTVCYSILRKEWDQMKGNFLSSRPNTNFV